MVKKMMAFESEKEPASVRKVESITSDTLGSELVREKGSSEGCGKFFRYNCDGTASVILNDNVLLVGEIRRD